MGTETAAHVELSTLEIASPNYIYGVKYQPTLPRQFQSIVDQLSIRREDFTFVDFGSGKGLALLLAAEAGFGRVIGIEFSPQLNAIAESNVLAFQRSTPRAGRIRCICGDAVSFAILDTPLICYFFNPFQEPVMRTVLGNIERSLAASPRPVYFVYRSARLADLIDASPTWRREFELSPYIVWRAQPG